MKAAALLLALLFAPVALADMNVQQLGVVVTTSNTAYGDGCSGVNGGTWRQASVTANDPRTGAGHTDIVVMSGCNRYVDGGNNVYESSFFGVSASNTQWNMGGPSAGYYWYGGSAAGTSYCGSVIATGSVAEGLGCPSPTGSPPPLLPTLP